MEGRVCMAHNVMCRACKKYFDIDKTPREEWMMPSKNWYYHTQCYSDWKHNQDATDDDWSLLIYDFLARDLKVSYNYHMCEAQRQKFLKENKFMK